MRAAPFLSRAHAALRAVLAVSVLMSVVGLSWLGTAPTASADVFTLPNGLLVDTTTEGEGGGRRIIVTVNDDASDVINVRSTGHGQFEREVVNRVATFIVNRDQVEVQIQSCINTFAGPSICGDWATFNPYPEPPAPAPEPEPAAEIFWVAVKYDCPVQASPGGTEIGQLNGYMSPDGAAEYVPYYGCEGEWCKIGWGPGDGRAWVWETYIDKP